MLAGANAAFHDPSHMTANPPPQERSVQRTRRLSRTDLIAIANSYFDGLSAHDGKLIMAHPGCERQENGVLTTRRPLPGGLINVDGNWPIQPPPK